MNRKLRLLGAITAIFLSLLSGCISHVENEWALKAMQIDKLRDLGFTGDGIRIGLIDTGVDLNKGNFDKRRFVAWKDLINGKENFYDDNGHGTFIAGLLFSKRSLLGGMEGICSGCDVIVVKAVSSTGMTNDSLLAEAIDFCIKSKADIILLSLYKNQDNIEIGEKSIEECIEAMEKGIFVVAPAGDDGINDDGDVFELSGIDGVISVGSINRNLYISAFSSRGNQAEVLGKHGERVDPNKKPELVAPGEGIRSIFGGGYVQKSGTSISASLVAGSIALLLEAYPDLKEMGEDGIALLKYVLAKTAKKIGSEDLYSGEDLKHNDRYGYGLIQVYDAYKLLGEMV